MVALIFYCCEPDLQVHVLHTRGHIHPQGHVVSNNGALCNTRFFTRVLLMDRRLTIAKRKCCPHGLQSATAHQNDDINVHERTTKASLSPLPTLPRQQQHQTSLWQLNFLLSCCDSILVCHS